MANELFFNTLVTKSLQPISGNERFFEGYLTVEVKDKQGEVTIVDELIKVLPIWMDRGAPITDTHSNRVIGKGINYQKTIYKAVDGQEYPAIKIIGKIHSNYELDNEIWSRIKSGEYKGLSFGGATKSNRTPFRMKDGSIAYQLRDLEHYEVAVCKDPAVPLALITDFNPIAKAMADKTEIHSEGKMLIRCNNFGCLVMKSDGEEAKEVIEREHELKGEKPSEEEEKIHEKVVEEQEKEDEEDTKKAMVEVDGDEMVIKVNLGKLRTFRGKVEALKREGKSQQSAENIVGAFVKREKSLDPQSIQSGDRGLGADPVVQQADSQQVTKKEVESQAKQDKRRKKSAQLYKSTAIYINQLIKDLTTTW